MPVSLTCGRLCEADVCFVLVIVSLSDEISLELMVADPEFLFSVSDRLRETVLFSVIVFTFILVMLRENVERRECV